MSTHIMFSLRNKQNICLDTNPFLSGAMVSKECPKNTDHGVQMHRLILVFAGCTSQGTFSHATAHYISIIYNINKRAIAHLITRQVSS